MGIRLLNGWLVIRDCEPDEKLVGSIHIPEGSYDGAHKWAEVLAVGKGRSTSGGTGWAEAQLKKGDKVLYVRFLKKTDTGKALSPVMEREYGAGSFLIQDKDVICYEPAQL